MVKTQHCQHTIVPGKFSVLPSKQIDRETGMSSKLLPLCAELTVTMVAIVKGGALRKVENWKGQVIHWRKEHFVCRNLALSLVWPKLHIAVVSQILFRKPHLQEILKHGNFTLNSYTTISTSPEPYTKSIKGQHDIVLKIDCPHPIFSVPSL